MKIDKIALFVSKNVHYPDCDLQVPAFREIAKNYLKQVRGGEENQNEHSDDEDTETRVDENWMFRLQEETMDDVIKKTLRFSIVDLKFKF